MVTSPSRHPYHHPFVSSEDDEKLLAGIIPPKLHTQAIAQLSEERCSSPTPGYIHNSTLPINRLPVELLMKTVFEKDEDGPVSRDYQWMAYMSVCRHWRTVALVNPSLWTDISVMNNIHFLRLFLRRSRSANVRIEFVCFDDLSFQYPSTHFGRFVGAIMQHTARIQTLMIRTPDVLYISGLFENRELRFKELCHLEVLVSGKSEAELLGSARRYPKLRSLSLTSVGMNLDTPALSMLTHLEIVEDYWSYPMAALLRILHNCMNVETLHISLRLFWQPEDCPSSITGSSDPRPDILLPKLHGLFFESTFSDIKHILGRLASPSLSRVTIRYLDPQWQPGIELQANKSLFTLLRSLIRMDGVLRLGIVHGDGDTICSLQSSGSRDRAVHVQCLGMKNRSISSIIHGIGRVFSAARIETLDFELKSPSLDSALVPQLKTLAIEMVDNSLFFDVDDLVTSLERRLPMRARLKRLYISAEATLIESLQPNSPLRERLEHAVDELYLEHRPEIDADDWSRRAV
ncbi:hypothetical protein OBBRIDRAFT_888353 [Obba rivulosa]|uniref:F-box domain-containing protein n=1 Tax=Obba rivulosa TaxID=1052685 RepID=A0A8E2AWN2_9APHY|nr:hypothetical protein OBBRIDRAFT_888353 [Obba rivulosa]